MIDQMAATFPLILIVLACIFLALLTVLILGLVAILFRLIDRSQEAVQPEANISAGEAEDFLIQFLGTMGHGNEGGDLMPLIAPSFIAKAHGSSTELRVNKFSVGAVKITRVDPPFVDVKISHHQPPHPRWARAQTYQLAREQGQLYIMPAGMGKHEYINPWWEDAPITRGQKLVFYLLDDPDQPLDKTTPRFKARHLNGKQDFTADMAPAMVVEEKLAFLAGEYASVSGSPDLSEKARTELQVLEHWIAAAPQKYVGFQIEK
jgi:hypothetical protein